MYKILALVQSLDTIRFLFADVFQILTRFYNIFTDCPQWQIFVLSLKSKFHINWTMNNIASI